MADIINEVTSAPETFTSWDKCMDKAYCKWPAIIGIVVGSLIVLSLLWCVVQCLCCGARMCSCCCGGCGGSGRHRSAKHKDDYSRMPPAPYGGYQPPPPAPMAYGYPMAPPSAPPQFATFDQPSSKIHEDSLPAMPSWDTATKRRVEDTSTPIQQGYNGDVEMGPLDSQPNRMRGGYNSVPNAAPYSPVTPHPQNEYFPNQSTGVVSSHHSDLGMQRMAPHGNDYDSFQAVPLSPPPTYRSESVVHSTSDKFAHGVASPSPSEYNHTSSYSHQQPASYAPSSISTRYEPPQPEYTPYSNQQSYQPRPPSFLQPGRKAVNGSFREV